MTNPQIKQLSTEASESILNTLQQRFEANKHRHHNLEWQHIASKLQDSPSKLWSLFQMEETGGEPDAIDYDSSTDTYLFVDCAPESPKGRRSACFDRAAQESRKKFKPEHNVQDLAADMGIELLNETQYRHLQTLGHFDAKTSSWIATPENIRKLGGALFADYRYDTVFVYHNGAESYYAARGFRGCLHV
ncbi:DUF4256 domain-containing protein [Mangrovimonas sp. DI 80]|uniref:DUF4256 domain-containing protein n=1 Tax=Mangrovimonas sp. DI 80 TaxID=1779330 RepID=UPI000977A25A|nr:DUF4256 domain-containing protein [Mangrovimonas sp. DI 80]OMP31858.1 hypothetical protein BKM32_02000 [Mangrovimonas sp. DI 80]